MSTVTVEETSGLTAREALEMVTDEDLAIFFHNLGETARLATRAECVEFGELTADARLMRRLTRDTEGANLCGVDYTLPAQRVARSLEQS